MAAKYAAENEKCGMCLEEWTNKEDVRNLDCGHAFCMDCLTENQKLSKITICPICRADHGLISDFLMLSLVYKREQEPLLAADKRSLCEASKCAETALVFCTNCVKLLCSSHEELIHGLIAQHSNITITEYNMRQQQAKLRYCDEHENQPIIVACSRCFAVKCDMCEQFEDSCPSFRPYNGKHVLGSMSQVAVTVKALVQTQIDQIEADDVESMKELKETLKSGDESLEANRRSLEQIEKASEDLKDEIDTMALELKHTVERSSDSIVKRMESANHNYKELSQKGTSFTDMARSLFRGDEVLLLKRRSELTQIANETLAARTTSVLSTALPLFHAEPQLPVFPISLRPKLTFLYKPQPDASTESTSENEKLKQTQIISQNEVNTNDHQANPPESVLHDYTSKFGNSVITVCHLGSGELVVGGEHSLLNVYGCDFRWAGRLMADRKNRSIISVVEHGNDLYVLSSTFGHEKDLHILHGEYGWVEDFTIDFNSTGLVQLAVNDEYVMIVDCSAKTIRVYCKSDLSLAFIMENLTRGRPWGIVALPDRTIVVSDKAKGKLINLAVGQNTRINWTCKGISQPTGLTLDTKSPSIIVGSYDSECVYIVSFEGTLIKKIELSRCANIHDVSVHGNHLAIADGTDEVEFYQIDY